MTSTAFSVPHAASALGLSGRVLLFAVLLGVFAAERLPFFSSWSVWHNLFLVCVGTLLGGVLPRYLDRFDTASRRAVTRRQDGTIVAVTVFVAVGVAFVSHATGEAWIAYAGACVILLAAIGIAVFWRRSATRGTHSA